MRVTCNSIDDFITNLTDVASLNVLNGIIYVDVTKRPVENAKFLVSIQATTVVSMEIDGQYLVVAGEECGRDIVTADADYSGSERSNVLKQRLVDFCKTKNWRILPGVCSE